MPVMRMRRLGWVLLTAAAPVQAQEFRTDLRLAADAEYDSNLLRVNAARGGGDGSDIRFTPALNVDIARPIGRDRISLGGVVGYDFHPRNSYLNRERIRLDAKGDLGIGAFCRGDVTGGVDFQQTDIADLGERVGNTSRQRSIGGAVDCTRRVGVSPTVYVQHTAVDNSLESRRRFDLRADDIRVGMAYARPSLGSVRVFGGVRRIAHPFRTTVTGSVGDSTLVTSAGIGVRRAVAPRLAFAAEVMWLKTRQRPSVVPGFSGLGWTTNLTWTPFPRFQLSATLDRSVRGESSFGSSYTVTTANALDLDYRVGHRTSVSLSLSQRKREFRGETLFDQQPARGWDDTWVIAGGADYALFRSLGLRARVAYRHRDSGNTFYRYSSTSGLLGARLRL